MSIEPTKLSLTPEQTLVIDWSDGRHDLIPVKELRHQCPCATCREKRTQPPGPAPLFNVLSPAETQPIRLKGMRPVGNYAYSIEFSDGHDSGIFTFEFLRQLGEGSGKPIA